MLTLEMDSTLIEFQLSIWYNYNKLNKHNYNNLMKHKKYFFPFVD